MTTMQAWQVSQPGGVEALKLNTVAAPELGPSDIRVAVHAVGINRADILQRKGFYPAPPGAPADILGLEYAGVITEIGSRVHSRQVGERVMGLVGGGAYAEQVVVHEAEALVIPNNYSFAEAAAIPEAFLTAYRAVFLEGQLAAGQWCLIRGATSSVGQAAIQLIAALGSRSIATSRSQARLDELSALLQPAQFDFGVVDQGAVADTVQAQTGGAHVVVDFVGGQTLADSLAAQRIGGRQVLVGVMGGMTAEINLMALLTGQKTLTAMTMRSQPLEQKIRFAKLFNDRLLPHFVAGRLKPHVHQTFDFSQAPQAHTTMESGQHLGKLVLIRD